jgi:hypothetical protein
MYRAKSILSALLALSLCVPVHAVMDHSVLGAGTTFAAYFLAKGSQQLWDKAPAVQHVITRDHAAAVVLGAVMILLSIVYHKKVLAGKSSIEKKDALARYLKGVVGSCMVTAGIEMWLNWDTDWSKTLFPTFSKLFSSKKE